jgi:hypothetical protein
VAWTRLAAEEARMKSQEPGPPPWAEAMLRAMLRLSDREPISGDLLEEYRAARLPARGALRANAWYFTQVLSVLWRLIRPCVLALVVTQSLFGVLIANKLPESGLTLLMMKGLWYGSLVQAPGVSLFDALIYLWAGYRGSRRTRLIRTGMLAAGATSFIGFTALFTTIAIRTPELLLAPFSKPFIFVILSVLLLLALSYSVVVGGLGGIIGRWVPPSAPREARVR